MAILASVAFLVLGNGLQQTLIGLRAGVEGYAEKTVGVMMSAYFVGFVLASVHAPRVIQRVGHIRAFAAFASAGSAFASTRPATSRNRSCIVPSSRSAMTSD